jgi:hypothetical protein
MLPLLLLLAAEAPAHEHRGSVFFGASAQAGSFLLGPASAGEFVIPGLKKLSVFIEVAGQAGGDDDEAQWPLIGLRGAWGDTDWSAWVEGSWARQVSAEKGTLTAWAFGGGIDFDINELNDWMSDAWRVQIDFMVRPDADSLLMQKKHYLRILVGRAIRFKDRH